MVKVLSAVETAFGKSNVPGVISIKRFSGTRFSVKRFSTEGDTISSVIVEEPTAADAGTENIVEALPDTSEVAIFSDEAEATDEIVASVDGGSIDPEITTALSSGFGEDEVVTTSSTSEELPDVIMNCGNPEVIEAAKAMMSGRRAEDC